MNASTPVAVPDNVLLRFLRSGEILLGFEHHAFAVLDETDPATLADLVISGIVGYGQLADLADWLLPSGHETRIWLDGRR